MSVPGAFFICFYIKTDLFVSTRKLSIFCTQGPSTSNMVQIGPAWRLCILISYSAHNDQKGIVWKTVLCILTVYTVILSMYMYLWSKSSDK